MATKNHDGWQLREHHMLATGGVLFALGFRAADARALDALLNMPLAEFRKLRTSDRASPDRTLGDVLRRLIDSEAAYLSAHGAALELERARRNYQRDRAAWLASGKDGPDAGWRQNYMTKGQRYLIHATCAALGIEPPPAMRRGDAADWLEAHDAHLLHRGERT